MRAWVGEVKLTGWYALTEVADLTDRLTKAHPRPSPDHGRCDGHRRSLTAKLIYQVKDMKVALSESWSGFRCSLLIIQTADDLFVAQ